MGIHTKAGLAVLTVLAACASQSAPMPDKPVAILEDSPHRYYQPLWPVYARAEAKAGKDALYAELKKRGREVGADAVIVERRYIDPTPAPGDEREIGLGDPYPEILSALEPGAFPSGTTVTRVYGPYVIVHGIAIRYPDGDGPAEQYSPPCAVYSGRRQDGACEPS